MEGMEGKVNSPISAEKPYSVTIVQCLRIIISAIRERRQRVFFLNEARAMPFSFGADSVISPCKLADKECLNGGRDTVLFRVVFAKVVVAFDLRP